MEEAYEEAAREYEESLAEGGDGGGGYGSEWAMIAFLLFGAKGIIFVLISMGTAFWVGCGGFERA